jgi:hypothetical protein
VLSQVVCCPASSLADSSAISRSMLNGALPVYVFVRSFVFTCSFGRENDVRSEQALRNGSVALECMHMYS